MSYDYELSFLEDKTKASLVKGTLYIVSTPIGNLGDITLRALATLREVDLIAAEDTRRTGLLLNAFGIKRPLISCYAHNEEKQGQYIIEQLKAGQTVALVSDAGMPGIADPGARVIRQAVAAHTPITVVPGASASVTALVASGFEADTFAFTGFFPRELKGKKKWLESFASFEGTLVFYESPKRLPATLRYLARELGSRYCCVARELTKKFEEFIRGDIEEVLAELSGKDSIKGEIVVVLQGQEKSHPGLDEEELEALGRNYLLQGMGKKKASKLLAEKSGIPSKDLYSKLISWDENN